MYSEPWNDIEDYCSSHKLALLTEIVAELSIGHVLYGKNIEILAKREDRDDVLVNSEGKYFIVHLTWSNSKEALPYPKTELYDSVELLRKKLKKDTYDF
ncbi:hypothetical protein [Pseudoalteromonas sp. Of7M-16]|uniref:hypothetical protein n=1 Tax=Pseudoalteromonas sp. Of7M-16 TaxID=2917756 RepID=UPI001EF4B6EB|nr:hypothetical protein [Pseudoalteromonas sp. Of7M-16]MCG7551168.1 hypothetical protein [Pseudoalteromonas sp. Of7M-16]